MTIEYLLNNVLSFYKTTEEKSHSYNLILEYREEQWKKALLAASKYNSTYQAEDIANDPKRLQKLIEESNET